MKQAISALAALLLVASCGGYPTDTEGTLAGARGGMFDVGWVEADRSDPHLQRLVEELKGTTGAQANIVVGPAELLLMRLEEGELDLVVGRFDAGSPWDTRVTFSKPVRTTEHAYGTVEQKAALRNGEHAWAMAVDRSVAQVNGRGR